ERYPRNQQHEEEERRGHRQDTLSALDGSATQPDPSPGPPQPPEQDAAQAEGSACRPRHDQGAEHVQQRPAQDQEADRKGDPPHGASAYAAFGRWGHPMRSRELSLAWTPADREGDVGDWFRPHRGTTRLSNEGRFPSLDGASTWL